MKALGVSRQPLGEAALIKDQELLVLVIMAFGSLL